MGGKKLVTGETNGFFGISRLPKSSPHNDFELLFTVASKDAVRLLDAWKKEFPKLPLTCVGKITAGEGITLRGKGGARPFVAGGYEHFKE